jgi:hypothetical protein
VLVAIGVFSAKASTTLRLATLFLALPISWRGTLAQYAGRLHRPHATKREVLVYVGVNEPMLAKMAAKRETGYRSLGYRKADEAEVALGPPDAACSSSFADCHDPRLQTSRCANPTSVGPRGGGYVRPDRCNERAVPIAKLSYGIVGSTTTRAMRYQRRPGCHAVSCGKHTPPAGRSGAASCRCRSNRSAGSEQRALFVPCDRETELVRETFGGQLDRVTVVQDDFHD